MEVATNPQQFLVGWILMTAVASHASFLLCRCGLTVQFQPYTILDCKGIQAALSVWYGCHAWSTADALSLAATENPRSHVWAIQCLKCWERLRGISINERNAKRKSMTCLTLRSEKSESRRVENPDLGQIHRKRLYSGFLLCGFLRQTFLPLGMANRF